METGLFEVLPEGLLVVDPEGRIVRANARVHEMFGYEPDALVGMAVEDLIPTESRARHSAHRAAYAAAPRVRPMGSGGMSLVGQRRDGEVFPVEIALSPLAGETPARILASVRDISESLRAKQEIVRARYDKLIAQLGHEALVASSMELLVDRLPDRLVDSLGGDLQIGLCLRRSAQRGEWVATTSPEIRDLDPERVLAELRDETALVGEASDPGVGAIVRVLANQSSCAVVPLIGNGRVNGALVGWARTASRLDHDAMHLLGSTATLVSAFLQRKQTEDQLAHAQRLDSLGQLTGGIAHDFNNLLTVMSGCLQLMAAEPGTPAASNALIESALRAVRSGADLTDKLLSFARRQRLRPGAIDVERLVADIRMLLERTIGGSITLEVAVEAGTPTVYADPAQLDAALVNLSLNARDAMPNGGRIRIAAGERIVTTGSEHADLAPGRYVLFSVEDSGTGMPADVAARAVEPFFSTKGTRGSGLGLSMVYGFVEQSGGAMSIASTPGIGTRVDLLLPAIDGVPEVRAIAHEFPSDAAGRALVVEDEAAVRSIAAAFMRSFGYDVVAVDGYDAALAALDSADAGFDIVFSDLMLGNGPDGMALAESVRMRWPGMPILLTSGHAHGLALPPTSEIGMLAKPYDRERLANAVAACRSKVAPPASARG
jgi:PAS domain S-box-containing protein